MIKIAPSILSADFSDLKNEIKKVEDCGADYIHVDVMDGHFVPNITMGPVVIQSLKKHTNLIIDTHLMIKNPLRYIDMFSKAGSDIITIHLESENEIEKCLKKIEAAGKIPAISIKPITPVSEVFKYLPLVKMVLIMTVEPGFGGQKFMSDMLPKIKELKKYITDNNFDIDIEVDGGINVSTAPQVIECGANILVAGAAIFYSDNPKEIISKLKLQNT